MTIIINQKTKFTWKCLCNSDINGKTIDEFNDRIAVWETNYIPQKGEILAIDNKEYIVKKIKRNLSEDYSNVFEKHYCDCNVEIWVENDEYTINYYDYVKKYPNYNPKTKEEWLKIHLTL